MLVLKLFLLIHVYSIDKYSHYFIIHYNKNNDMKNQKESFHNHDTKDKWFVFLVFQLIAMNVEFFQYQLHDNVDMFLNDVEDALYNMDIQLNVSKLIIILSIIIY